MNKSQPKRIFISHTKNEAPIAQLLKKWLDETFKDDVQTFVSETDITAGKQWLQVVEEAMTSSQLVIVLCSPVSIRKTWVIFEAGAAWGQDKVGLLPICHSGLLVPSLPSPLSSFQALQLEHEGFATRFQDSIQDMLGLERTDSVSTATVPDIQKTLDEAREKANRFDVFVSTPMTAFSGSRYKKFRKSFDGVLGALSKTDGLSRYYFAGKTFGNVQDFDDNLVGTRRDLGALSNSDRFMLVLPEKLASSSLVEAGFALALGIPSALFVRNRDDLPWALREIGQLSESTTVSEYTKLTDIERRVAEHGEDLWPKIWGRAYV